MRCTASIVLCTPPSNLSLVRGVGGRGAGGQLGRFRDGSGHTQYIEGVRNMIQTQAERGRRPQVSRTIYDAGSLRSTVPRTDGGGWLGGKSPSWHAVGRDAQVRQTRGGAVILSIRGRLKDETPKFCR
jgi:hypothetical protein